MLEYLWSAEFEDGHVIDQPSDDRYSKHDDSSEWNPSSFRDIQEYDKSPLVEFSLVSANGESVMFVNLKSGDFYINGSYFRLEKTSEEINNRDLIYFRTNQKNLMTGEQRVVSYNFGYKGKDSTGHTVEKLITIGAEHGE